MKFQTTRHPAGSGASFYNALVQGLAPDGGLYVPESIEPLAAHELARLPNRTLTEIAYRALRPYTRDELDATIFEALVVEALNFPIPLVEVEPGIYALELFHGPTLAFKDVGARTMARLMAALDTGDQALTVLAATSGDTGSAVAHAFHGVPHTRVVVLYPDGRVSPTQEAQLTMFNAEAGNVRAYAVAGSFDDCHKLTKEAFSNPELRRRVRLTSANSVNIGRLLPQMVYYFHAVARLRDLEPTAEGRETFVCTPSGNFGNLTAGLMAKRAGLPIARFVAATNANDVVPSYLTTGRFEPRASVATIANAMDVGNPSNFERMLWLYDSDLEAMRRDVLGSVHTDDEVRATIKRVFEKRGYLLDPHSAIAYLGLKHNLGQAGSARGPREDSESAPAAIKGRDDRGSAPASGGGAPRALRNVGQAGEVGSGFSRIGIFLATAHPAKFGEIVEPIIRRPIVTPAPLADALARPRHILRMDASLDAVRDALVP